MRWGLAAGECDASKAAPLYIYTACKKGLRAGAKSGFDKGWWRCCAMGLGPHRVGFPRREVPSIEDACRHKWFRWASYPARKKTKHPFKRL